MKKNILVIIENHKNHILNTLYFENLILKKYSRKFSLFFWGPGFDFKTNDVLKKVRELEKKKIQIHLIYICLSQFNLIKKYDYRELKKFKIRKKFENFPINLSKVQIPKILLIVDFWQLNKFEWELLFKKNQIQYVFSARLNFELKEEFNNKFLTNYIKKNVKFIQYVRTIKECNFIHKNIEKRKIDIIQLGANWKKFYPYRKKFEEKVKNIAKKYKLNFFTKNHPGYNIFEKKKHLLIGNNYFKKVSESKIMISDSTFFGTHLNKTIECLKYGTIYMTSKIHKPFINNLKNNYNYIEVNENNIEKKIVRLLNNSQKLKTMSRNAKKTYKNFYSNKVFIKNMEEKFEKIIKEHTHNPNTIIKKNYLWLNLFSICTKLKIIFLRIYYKILNINKFPI